MSPTPPDERFAKKLGDMQAKIDRLKTISSLLVEACKSALPVCEMHNWGSNKVTPTQRAMAVRRIEAALAEAGKHDPERKVGDK